jgi:hypothetical protein
MLADAQPPSLRVSGVSVALKTEFLEIALCQAYVAFDSRRDNREIAGPVW